MLHKCIHLLFEGRHPLQARERFIEAEKSHNDVRLQPRQPLVWRFEVSLAV